MLSRHIGLTVLAVILVGVDPASAQPPIIKEAIGDAAGGNRRNDLEGGVWEFKVIDRRSKKTMLVGKLRIKDSAAFDVAGSAEGELAGGADADEGPPSPPGFQPPKRQRLGVFDRIAEGNRGGDRIADVLYERARNTSDVRPRVTFRFDTDDEHPLSGKASVQYDTRHGGDVWKGWYYQVLEDGEKQRWDFELRFIED